jgi:hypothetical protein
LAHAERARTRREKKVERTFGRTACLRTDRTVRDDQQQR